LVSYRPPPPPPKKSSSKLAWDSLCLVHPPPPSDSDPDAGGRRVRHAFLVCHVTAVLATVRSFSVLKSNGVR